MRRNLIFVAVLSASMPVAPAAFARDMAPLRTATATASGPAASTEQGVTPDRQAASDPAAPSHGDSQAGQGSSAGGHQGSQQQGSQGTSGRQPPQGLPEAARPGAGVAIGSAASQPDASIVRGGTPQTAVLYDCQKLASPVAAQFTMAGNLPSVALAWGNERVMLPRALSASGARYAAGWIGGSRAQFWIKGNEALFTLPAGPTVHCTVAGR